MEMNKFQQIPIKFPYIRKIAMFVQFDRSDRYFLFSMPNKFQERLPV